MKYSDNQIKEMLANYFREVSVINWEKFTSEEYKRLIDEGSFKVVENFTQAGDLSREDVLIYLSGTVPNYHVFLIRQNRLIEVHQEHHSRWCLTCDELGEKSPYIDRED